jgi:hypothetical protein
MASSLPRFLLGGEAVFFLKGGGVTKNLQNALKICLYAFFFNFFTIRDKISGWMVQEQHNFEPKNM